MTSEVLTQSISAGGQITLGQGRIFNILQATSPITVVCDRRSIQGGQTQVRKFTNIPAGTKFIADKGDEWTYLRITSALAQTLTIFVGDEDVSFNNAVTITGVAQSQNVPNSTIASPAAGVVDGNIATGAALAIPANATRKALTISSPTTNTGVVYVQQAGAGAGPHGIPLQPGTFVTLTNTAAVDVRNDSGANQYITTFEES